MRFLKSRSVLASMIGVFALIVAACGTSSTSTTTTAGSGQRYGNVPYSYTTPTHKGGTIVFGDWQTPDSANAISSLLDPTVVNADVLNAMWDSCILQESDVKLALQSWHASLCTQVPTTQNGGESADGHTTTIHIDPAAKWSDGTPITADDMLMYYNIFVDPNIVGAGSVPPWDKTKVTKVDAQTVQYDWGQAYAPYLLNILGFFPSHLYPKVYDATTGKYDTAAAQKLINDPNFLNNPVTDGAYKIQSFGTGGSAVVMVPNPQYHSNYFHAPVADKLIFQAAGSKDALIQAYKAGGTYQQVEDFTFADTPKFSGINPNEVIQTAAYEYEHLEFDQRGSAPNAKLNGGTSIFADQNVRKAFIEGFNKCRILTGILGVACNDPAYQTDEFTVPLDPSFDPNTHLPAFNATQAAADLTAAGYPVNGGVRMMKDGKTPMVINVATTSNNLVRNSTLALIQQDWATNLNITVTLTESTKSLFSSYADGGLLSTGTFDVALFAFSTSDDGDSLTCCIFSGSIPSKTNQGGQNYSGINDPNLDSQLAAARVELNTTTRIGDYKQIFQEITNQYEFYPLYVRPNIALVSTTLGNYSQNPVAVGNTWNIADWYLTQ